MSEYEKYRHYEPYTHNDWDITFCMRRDCAKTDCKRHKDGKNYQDMLIRARADYCFVQMYFEDCKNYSHRDTER